MNDFRKRLVSVRDNRLNKVAEGEEGKIDNSPELQNYVDQGWVNQYGKVTPYHILMMEDAATLYGTNINQAKQQVEDKYNQVNEQFRDMADYTNPSQETTNKFLNAIRGCRSVNKLIETITNFSLKSEDLGVNKGADLEEETLEKFAKHIASQLENQVRELFASLKK